MTIMAMAMAMAMITTAILSIGHPRNHSQKILKE
jgi:hypothetical protein